MYKMSELLKFTAEELKDIEKQLWADWEQVSRAYKVVSKIEEEE